MRMACILSEVSASNEVKAEFLQLSFELRVTGNWRSMTLVLEVLWALAAIWGVSFACVMAGFVVDTVRTRIGKHRARRTPSVQVGT